MPVKYIIAGLLGIGLFVILSEWSQQHTELLKELADQAGLAGVLSYIIIMAVSIIFAPLGTGFLLPVAASSYGPVLAAVYSITGWTTGSLVSFWIARHFGHKKIKNKAFVLRLKSYEDSIPRYYFYGLIVLFRMALPVDVVSYALGFVSGISYRAFLVTTVLGIMPMAFLFTFAATASVWIQIGAGVLATSIFIAASYLLYREYLVTEDKAEQK